MSDISNVKINALVVLFLTVQELTQGATSYFTNSGATKEDSPPSLYSIVPQTYYIPQAHAKYYSSSNQKYLSQSDSQIPVAISSTEKTYVSPAYRVTVDTSKYTTSQAVKPTQISYNNQKNYPYLYTVAKIGSPTAASYAQVENAGSNYYEDVPKKYHYGYRVSDVHTGTEFGHSEVNDGHSAKGYYHVLLPDGRLQNVKYWAGPSGYHATITGWRIHCQIFVSKKYFTEIAHRC